MPRKHGYDVVNAIKAMELGDVDLLFCLGGNFISATPQTARTSKAVQSVAMTIHVSTKLNRSHLITGDESLILPCLGRTELDIQNGIEQFVTVENSMGVVHMSRRRIKPASINLRSEPRIVAELASKTIDNSKSHGLIWLMIMTK